MKKLLLSIVFIFFGISIVFPQTGFTCSDPIVISTLPYSTTDDTANYGDLAPLEGMAGSSGCGSTNSYLNGNDVVYSYTATTTGIINVSMTPTGTFSGIFAYSSCANIGVNCLAGVANSGTGVRTFNLAVTAGATYYIVISTWAAPQTTSYTLTIQAGNCTPPNNLSATNITQTSAQLTWTNPSGATSWEVEVQPLGATIPTGSGTSTDTNTNFIVDELSPGTPYQYYVRASCGNGTYSTWVGPYLFSTTCYTFNVPFQEGFNGNSPTESCWTVLNVNNDADSWNTNYTINPYEGNQCATLNTDLNGGNNNDWLISPTIMLTGNEVLKFRHRVQSSAEPNDFKVMISLNGTNPADFTATLVPLTTYSNTDYIQTVVPLSGITGPVNIAWVVPSGNSDGWRIYIDNVIVETAASCPEPYDVVINNASNSAATVGWSGYSMSNNWEILAVPCGSPVPTASTAGQPISSNPFVITDLLPTTCYTVYVRAVCSENDKSIWSTGVNFNTSIVPPVCGGTFTDQGGPNGNYFSDSNSITTICPSIPGEVVTVVFTSFNTEAMWDGLYIYDGNSIAAPMIPSMNSAGNVPGNLPGAFWGTTLPGPFSSTSADGCLTFWFRSDSSTTSLGWIANVICSPAPTCSKPAGLALTDATQSSLSFSWTETGAATAWEVIALPANSPAPSPSASGTPASSNQANISDLQPGTTYNLYVRSLCQDDSFSYWSQPLSASTLVSNDECENAIVVPVNANDCAQVTPGRITGATASNVPLLFPCIGIPDDDVWFQFVATNSNIVTSLQNVTGTTTNLNLALYSGSCGNLTQLNCSNANSLSLVNANLTIGETYFLRVYSNANAPQNVTFTVCVNTPSTCAGGESICGVDNYSNSTGVPSMGTIGCLFTTPNPTYFTLKISDSGSVNLLLTQSTINGGPPNLDVDFAAWGPFTDQATACTAISNGMAPTVSGASCCSYSSAPTENLSIPNAIAGEYYIVLVTNFSNQAGFINATLQSTSTGAIDCTGIRMIAFLDNNANGTKEADEAYFPLGQFHYQINNDQTIHHITSPSGTYAIYDDNPANSYNLNYSIDQNYASTYSTSASYSNIIVTSAGMTTYNFPITVLQNHDDLGIAIVPLGTPRAGFTYKNNIVYTNNGTQTIASGSLSYTANVGTTITNISQTGTTPITNGFTYNFTNLLPFESRTITVTITVPPIPSVSIGQLLTNNASIVPPAGDIVTTNNTSASTQAVIASYDPNDKTESHGDKILFSTFGSNDYLNYTIRFENTGNAGALDVRVSDVLDSQLDETTLIMIDASHDYTLDRVGNTLVWNFENIMLPVSVPETTIGKGYINFKIKPKPGYAVGDVIPNTASIFFDLNPPIVTNTFNTEFVNALSNPEFNLDGIVLYPNPACDFIKIQSPNNQIATVNIYDISGKRIYTSTENPSNEISINVSNFAKGLYLVDLSTIDHKKTTKKLIIK